MRLRTVSLRRRVTVAAIVVVAIALSGAVLVVDALFTVQTNRATEALLTDRAALVQQLARQNPQPLALLRRVDGRGVRAEITLPGGETLGTGPDADTAKTRRITVNSGRLSGATVTLSADIGVLTNAQTRLRRLLILTALGALAVVAAVLVWVVRVALRPLDTMTGLARSIAAGQRGGRLSPERTDTELGRTAAAFDAMLDALEGAERQARGSEARTRRFVADAAHELRTPIAGVQAVAEAVVQQRDPEQRARMEALLVRESRRAGRLVDDLLALARIDAGMDLDRAPVDLLALTNSEADRTRLLAPGLAVQVTGDPVTVTGDAGRLTQILANLMDNARQASPPDGTVSVHIGLSGGWAQILVSDNGSGVPAVERDRVFDRLVRLDAARDRRSGGSGLGLAIARGFARAHGGDLTCPGPPPGGSGAVFRLVLPR